MLSIIRPDKVEVSLGSPFDQVYSLEDLDGWQYYWSVAEATRRAKASDPLFTISLSEIGITCDFIRSQYDGLDEAHAMTTCLMRPLLFVPHKGQVQLIDGWHRLFKAATLGVDILPAWMLSEEDGAASLVIQLPPGHGLDWGQGQQQAA